MRLQAPRPRIVPRVFRPSVCRTSPEVLLSKSTIPLNRPTFARPLPVGSTSTAQPFSTSACLFKKSGKLKERKTIEHVSSGSEQDDCDPYNFETLDLEIQQALDHLKDDLSKLRSGGRFNPEVIEDLRITLDKGRSVTTRLGELAQVVPRGGRLVIVLVGEADHVKPITSAILASPYSLNPTPSLQNQLELHILVPPPTQESRQQAVTAALKAGERAAKTVREARGTQQKKLRAMALTRRALPDDLRKAGDKMEKVVEKGNVEVKTILEGARKALERG